MLKLISISIVTSVFSYQYLLQSNTSLTVVSVYQKDSKVDNALSFINDYVRKCNNTKDEVKIVDWVASSNLATKDFKLELKRIEDDAHKAEPEVGLDFDPIFDAQDYPEKGFELESFDEQTGYLSVKGNDWPQFKVTMRIKHVNGSWLVEGCGIVNIPTDKRAKR